MLPSKPVKLRALLDWAAIALFALAIGAPPLRLWIGGEDLVAVQRDDRPPPERPYFALTSTALESFPRRFESWHDRVFGFRLPLLKLNSIEKVFVYGVSSVPSVYLGEQRWMYFRGDSSVEDYRGLLPFSPNELLLWQRRLEERRDWCAAHGIAYVYAIGPNKETVYPEFLPAGMTKVGPTRLEQLALQLDTANALPVLDLRAALIAEKRGDAPNDFGYFPYGTHWCGRGVHAAYTEIVHALSVYFPRMRPIAREDCDARLVTGLSDSWAQKMLIEEFLPQPYVALRPKGGFHSRPIQFENDPVRKRRAVNDSLAGAPTALMFHDSFGVAPEAWLCEHFSSFTSVQQQVFDTQLVLDLHPDAVIEIFVQRGLCLEPPNPLGSQDQERNRAQFERSQPSLGCWNAASPGAWIEPRFEAALELASTEFGPGLSLRVDAPPDAFVLPELAWPAQGEVLLHFDVEAPADTKMLLYVLREDQREYWPARRIELPLQAGRNLVYWRLSEPGIHGGLCLRPGELAGTYVLRAFEARVPPR